MAMHLRGPFPGSPTFGTMLGALAIFATTALTPLALAAEFAPIIGLGTLNGKIGFRIDGVAAGDQSGFSVASAGDVNGDGFTDLIVGADGADPNGAFSGSSYVVFGRASGFAPTMNLSSLDGSTGFRLDGVVADDKSGAQSPRRAMSMATVSLT